MLIRVGAALTALYCLHGGENIARDSSQMAQAVRENGPKAAIELCVDHAALCRNVAGQVVGAENANLAVGLMEVNAPKPPRKTVASSLAQEPYHGNGLDRDGLKRALLAKG